MTERRPASQAIDIAPLPYPIAAPIDLMYREANPIRRLHLLLHAHAQIVRFIALCLVSDYARHPHLRDGQDGPICAGLQRPSLGHWVAILRDIPAAFARHGEPLFLDQWPFCHDQLQRLRHPGCVGADVYADRVSLPPIEALLRLRNTLAHGGLPPEDALSRDLYEHYHPILADLLETLSFLNSLRLHRIVEREEAHVSALLMRGPAEPFRIVALAPAVCFTGITTNCVLTRTAAQEPGLPLSPLFLGRLDDLDAAVTEEMVLSYDGFSNRRVYYLGIHRKMESRSHYDSVVSALFGVPSQPSQDWPGPLLTRILHHSRESVLQNQGVKYHPEVYQPRGYHSALLQDFARSRPKVSGLLLVAESGSGKTSLLCDAVSQWLEGTGDTEKGLTGMPLPLMVSARNFGPAPPGLAPHYEPGTLGLLGRHLRTVLDLDGVSDWESLVDAIAAGLALPTDRELPRFLLIVDAINESEDSFHLLQEFDYAVGLARARGWLRCVATIRREACRTLLTRFDEESIRWPAAERAYVREPDDSGQLTLQIALPVFSQDEVRQTYERYRIQSETQSEVPVCLTSYSQLPEVLRQMISRPLLMRLLMQTFDRRAVPAVLSPVALFDRFHGGLVAHQAETAEAVARLCLRNRRPYLTQADAESFLQPWREARDDYERLVYLDPLEQLCDAGVLIRNSRHDYAFAHQLYLEFLCSREFGEAGIPAEEVEFRLLSLIESPLDHLEEEAGAWRTLISQRIAHGETSLLERLVPHLCRPLFCEFFTPLALHLHAYSPDAYWSLVRCLEQQHDPSALLGALEVLRHVGDRTGQLSVLRSLLARDPGAEVRHDLRTREVRLLIMSNHIKEATVAVTRLKAAAEAECTPRLMLDAVAEEGYLNFVVADSPRALAAYSQALTLLQTLREGLTEESYLLKRWEILKGKGCVEHNMDENAACQASHREALGIAIRLEDPAGIALSQVNLADAQWGCGEYGSALRTYQEAVDAGTRACYQDGLDVALIGQGIVHWSVGCVDEALTSLSAGLQIARQLDYAWDLSYGLIYLGNAQASQGEWDEATETHQQAFHLAEQINAHYLINLSRIYGAWMSEVHSPGADANRLHIKETLEQCAKFDLRGLKLMAQGLFLMNSAASPNASDAYISKIQSGLSAQWQAQAHVKGPLEVLGMEIARTGKRHRPGINWVEIEDFADELCERKMYSLPSAVRERFLLTRNSWGRD